MMPCLSASRGYRPSSSPSASPSPSPSPSPTSATTCSSFCCVISDTKSASISSSGSEMSSSLFVSRKKARTRRKRPQQMYNEAAAALSAIYPNIFCCGPHHKKIDSKVWKNIGPLRFKDVGATEFLLQEVPTLIGSGRVREVEEGGLLCNEGTPPELKCGVGIGHKQLLANDSDDAKSKVEGESSSSLDESVSGGSEYDCFLESNIDGGIMSSIMGSHTNAETEGGLGVSGVVEQGTEYSLHSSAIRALRRTSDSMLFPVFDYSLPRLKLSDKIMAEKERNTFFSSLEWLNAKERLKLKLNYEDVLNTWSDRGPLYTDKVQPPQIVPDDSFSDPMVQFHSG